MKAFAGMEFDASVNPGDPEFIGCLRYIEIALMLADWKQQSWDGPYFSLNRSSYGQPTIGLGSSVSNVAIFFLHDDTVSDTRNADAAMALAEALTLEGVTTAARPTFKKEEFGAHKQYPIHIAVGTKT